MKHLELFNTTKKKIYAFVEGGVDPNPEAYNNGVALVRECVDMLKEMMNDFENIPTPELNKKYHQECPELIDSMNQINKLGVVATDVKTIIEILVPTIQLLFCIKQSAKEGLN